MENHANPKGILLLPASFSSFMERANDKELPVTKQCIRRLNRQLRVDFATDVRESGVGVQARADSLLRRLQ
jgi:hypothetical protein